MKPRPLGMETGFTRWSRPTYLVMKLVDFSRDSALGYCVRAHIRFASTAYSRPTRNYARQWCLAHWRIHGNRQPITLKGVAGIVIEHCPQCGRRLKIIAAPSAGSGQGLNKPRANARFLAHLDLPARAAARAPTQSWSIPDVVIFNLRLVGSGCFR